jgi:hypothetical protein
MEQQDMQKRFMIFFGAVALLLISFSLISQYFLKTILKIKKIKLSRPKKRLQLLLNKLAEVMTLSYPVKGLMLII